MLAAGAALEGGDEVGAFIRPPPGGVCDTAARELLPDEAPESGSEPGFAAHIAFN